jgi:hypothetical protein
MRHFKKFHLSFLIPAILFSLFTGSLAYSGEDRLKATEEREDNILSTPQQAYNTLIETIISGDIKGYEMLLNRPLNEQELNHIDYIKNKRPESRIKKITPLLMLSRGFKGEGENRVLCIVQDVVLRFAKGSKGKRRLETCFKKKEEKWIFIPNDVRLFQ